jgi:type VI secretion system protein ImpL
MNKNILKHPQANNILLLLLVIVIIYWLGPHIHVAGYHPLQSFGSRTVLSVAACLVYVCSFAISWLNLKEGQGLEKMQSSWVFIKAWLQKLAAKVKLLANANFADLKAYLQNDQQRRHLKKTPWYLVLGSPKSGKQRLISNSGLRFLTASYYGRQAINLVEQFKHCRWYFADEAVFVDVASYDEAASLKIDRKLIRLMRKQRRSKPMSGVIFTFSLPELILATHENRRNFLKSVADQIKNLYQMLKTPIPIYLVFTKTDLISGFTEFFSDLSKEDLSQVWGITFPLRDASNVEAITTSFKHEYSQLLARLQQRVLWTLDSEKKQSNRNLVYNFPQQMQLFAKPINMMLGELFAMLPRHHILQMRGVYFTSAEQQGQPYNFFLHAIGKRYDLKSNYRMAQENHTESYFVQRLFYDVIFAEQSVLGYSERVKKLKKALYRLTWVSMPALVVFSAVSLHAAYKTTKIKSTLANDNLQQYSMALQKLVATDTNITHTLPTLDALKNVEDIFHYQLGWSKILFASHYMYFNASSALDRTLHTEFLPRIAANLELQLQGSDMDTDSLYANLKGYLAFSPIGHIDSSSIRAPMQIGWDRVFQNQLSLLQSLRYYLDRSSDLVLDELPLDSTLISRVRQELQQIEPQQRAYALLSIRALASEYPDIDLPVVVGKGFSDVFSMQSIKDQDGNIILRNIPDLYTDFGYNKIFKKYNSSIARQVADDNREIGLEAAHDNTQSYAQIVSEVQRDYNTNYMQAWQRSLGALSVVKFNNYQQAVAMFDLLSGGNSPLTKLLAVVSDNTQDIKGTNIDVADKYAKLNDFGQSSFSTADQAKMHAVFQQLRQYFANINAAADSNKEDFNAAVAYMKGDKNNPINALSALAAKAPAPLNAWLQQLADNSWQLVLNGALQYINAAWSSNVMPAYRAQIMNMYPINRNAVAQVGLGNFQQFFSVNGTLDTFFKQYLKPFVKVDTRPWQIYKLNGHSLALTPSNLQIFNDLQQIQALYFANDPQHAGLQFTIVPLMLDDHASSVSLQLGDNSLLYQHGPLRPTAIKWPFNINNESSKLILNDFSGHRAVLSSDGGWSLFKLLDNMVVTRMSDGNGYNATVHLGANIASFNIISDASIAAFQLTALKNFNLPAQLGVVAGGSNA